MSFQNNGKPRGLPTEILEKIFTYASPWELIQLQISCRYFGEILEKQSIWRSARKRLIPPVPDPILPTDVDGFTGNWSEMAYAKFIFGQTVCTFCREPVPFEQMSASFSLRERACVFKKRCIAKQMSQRVRFPNMNNDSEWPLFVWDLQFYLPYAENSSAPSANRLVNRLYNLTQYKKAFAYAKNEWNLVQGVSEGRMWRSGTGSNGFIEYVRWTERVDRRKAWLGPFMETARALVAWHKDYCDEVMVHSGIRKLNFSIANEVAESERIRFAAMERSETMRRCLIAHSRSQTVFTLAAWHSIRAQVLKDIADQKAGIFKLPLPNDFVMKVACPYCPRHGKLFAGGLALKDHIRVVHPELRVAVTKSTIDPRILIL